MTASGAMKLHSHGMFLKQITERNEANIMKGRVHQKWLNKRHIFPKKTFEVYLGEFFLNCDFPQFFEHCLNQQQQGGIELGANLRLS